MLYILKHKTKSVTINIEIVIDYMILSILKLTNVLKGDKQ